LRSFLLTAKIAVVFAILAAVALAATLYMFLDVAGHDLVRDFHFAHAYQGVGVAERIEEMLDEHDVGDGAVSDWVAAEARRRSVQLTLHQEPGGGPEIVDDGRHGGGIGMLFGHRLPARVVDVLGRPCRVAGPPLMETWVPIYHEGREVASLEVHGMLHTFETHEALVRGITRIGVLTLAAVVALAIYLTVPLRRMRRSMDRIADGELEHRVPVRGHDEVARMGKSFNAMADRIRDMITGQKELTAGVSHELRSPLARMKLSLELLRQSAGAGIEERTADLEADVDAVDGLVEELLLASRIELGSNPLDPEPLELAAVAAAAWGRVESDAARRGVTLSVEPGPGAERVAADRALTVRLLGNLFENAVRYAGKGVVTVVSRRLGDRVEITVADRGPGVETGHLERLFEPFYRVDASRSRKTGAGGLGLMIVRRAVEAHGGRARAETAAGGGLAVVFDLPAADDTGAARGG
jgi:signal transduction histidine kinase